MSNKYRVNAAVSAGFMASCEIKIGIKKGESTGLRTFPTGSLVFRFLYV